jgi:hypothetical protein
MLDERDELIAEWTRLEVRRRTLAVQYVSQLGACVEDEAWLTEYTTIEEQQEILALAIGAHELLLSAEEKKRRPGGSAAVLCRTVARPPHSRPPHDNGSCQGVATES